MARKAIVAVNSDFLGVVEFLKKKGIVPAAPSARFLENAKRIHRATYSLILWRFRLRNLPDGGRVFIEEIASDALQILPQALTGYSKTTKLLTRGIIENTFRHIYFTDHSIEFKRMNRDAKWYLQTEELFAYPSIHEELMDLEQRFAAVTKLRTLYSTLSGDIHGRRVENLEMRRALTAITYDDVAVEREAELVERCAESVNFLLAAFHRTAFRAFVSEDRRTITQTMERGARRVLSDI